MARAVAVNVGANTNEPGFRGPIWPDGRFTFVPIPETAPTRRDPPTYADLALDLPFSLSPAVADRPVHLDPEFRGYPFCERYTYGDPWGVKAGPLLDLEAGGFVFFYATLAAVGETRADWVVPDWGAYLVGHFRLAFDPLPGEALDSLRPRTRRRFANNAHLKREQFDAAVLLAGDETSRLYDRAVPLSDGPGTAPNHIVTEWSADSGAGPWWRRPLRFDEAGTSQLLAAVEDRPFEGQA